MNPLPHVEMLDLSIWVSGQKVGWVYLSLGKILADIFWFGRFQVDPMDRAHAFLSFIFPLLILKL